MATYVGAAEAARLLGVTKPTLYAYVSRGMVTRRSAADGRTSLYARDELERLAERHQRRPASADPTIDIVIRSAVTEIDDRSVRYRGYDAAALARSHTFEYVAELLWSGELPSRPVVWPVAREPLRRARALLDAAQPVGPVGALALGLVGLDGDDAAVVARRVLGIAPTLLGGPQHGSTAQRLAAAWRRSPDPSLVAAIDRALVLLADHELASSTLAVRVACSVGAAPADSLAAGIHTVAGALHGAASRHVVELLREVERVGARDGVAGVLRAGRRLPGFGHAVYRTADPRLDPLLDAVRELPDPAGHLGAVDALLAESGRVLGKVPNVDLGLGALIHVGGLPDDAPIFAIARIAGWAAHHAEEAAERPGRYRGLTRR
jgi:citrate synthase